MASDFSYIRESVKRKEVISEAEKGRGTDAGVFLTVPQKKAASG
jgi:hypothetical protein